MPKDPRIKKVLVIGSGPIIIGQAAEFDYSGTQACRALKAEGIETVLLNSNPATIMTDPDVADHVYIEPMTLEVVERILDIEKPDSVLPNLGGQMGLNLSMELARSGYLDRTGIRLLACKPETIDRAEDRELFKETMEKLHQPIIPSEVVETLEDRSGLRRPHRLPGHRPPGLHHGRHRRRHLREQGKAHRDRHQRPPSFPHPSDPWWKSASRAGKRSSTRSCATTRATSSPSATWRTLTLSASTPVTPWSWHPPRP